MALALPGYILSGAPDARWARLVGTCCTAAGGRGADTVPTAAAIEVFMVALDILDDEEDDEEGPLRAQLGSPCALNVSTGLLFLAESILLDTPGGDGATRTLLGAGLRACSGQHADLSASVQDPVSLEDALRVTAGKSASLVAAACAMGAQCAGAHGRIQQLYARFGWCLGMVMQLADDIAAIHPNASGKTDIALGRPTLPLIYAAKHAPTGVGLVDDARTRAALWSDGAAYLTWAVADAHRRQAVELADRLTGNPASRDRLAALLPALA